MGLCGCCDSVVLIDEIGNSCPNHSPLYWDNSLWIPANNDEIKYVKVNFIFLHKQSDGIGNFVSGNQEHEAIIADLISQINDVYSSLYNPNDSNCHVYEGFISDTKIRIVPNIIHYTDSYYWNNENDSNPICSTYWLEPLNEQIVNNPLIEKAINIYFTENATEFNNLVVYQNTQDPPATIVACSYPPSINDFASSSIIHMPGVYSKYYWMKNYAPIVYPQYSWDQTIREWFICSVGNQIAHELGHSFHLSHVGPCQYNLMSSNTANNYFDAFLTPDQIGEMHRYLSISSVRKYSTDVSYLSTPYSITTDTEWDLNFTSYRDVIIEAGAVLTITCKLVMKSNTRIIIKPGGKLVVDGGIITTEDNHQWQGVEVWGNSSIHQSSINGVFGQGFLELKNGAIIENAKCAVELWRPGHYSTTGGILHASDATFLNNAMAVRAVCYSNYNPATHVEVNYDAYFNNCGFVIDNNFLGTETFQKHVVLAEVNGITFRGCDFTADRSVMGVHPWCIGISAYDAGFSVDSPCTTLIMPCPDEDYDHSTFTGLCSGINAASNGNHPRSFMVRHTVFNGNDCGISAKNTNFPTIVLNDFVIGGGGYCDYSYGVRLQNITGFCIEENFFQPSLKPESITVGVAIYNSNGINDVYGNTFDGLLRATLALGQNTNGVTGALQGLTYTCNEFNGNQRDIMVLKKNGVGDIQPQQGSAVAPAGNQFKNSTFQIYNDGTNQLVYHYNSNGSYETPSTSMLYRVTPSGTTSANACSSHYGNSPVVKSPSEKAELASEYLSSYNAYLDLKRLFESHSDDSDMEDPTADNNTDILQLTAQMAQYGHEFTLAAGDIVRSNLNDSIADPTELRTWLGNMNDIASDRMIISSYIQEGDSASAFALANMLPALYELQGDQLTDHYDYLRLIGIYQTLHRSGRNVLQLTETETGVVRNIAENGMGVSQSMAEVLMEQITERGMDACFDAESRGFGNGDRAGMTYSSIVESEENGLNVGVAPNPAMTWTMVNYSLPKQGTRASLTLTDMLGVKVLSMELEGTQGNKAIDLRNLAAGVYVYTVRYEQFIETGKLVITR